MRSIEGQIILAQETRFQLLDRDGVAHHFVLSYLAGAEPEQLASLQRNQAPIRVAYEPAEDLIGHTALRITLLDS